VGEGGAGRRAVAGVRWSTAEGSGGGAVEHPATAERLKDFDVVYLEVPYEDALARVGGDEGRPLLAQADLPDRYRRRLPSYAAVAARTVPTANRPPEAIAQEILARTIHRG